MCWYCVNRAPGHGLLLFASAIQKPGMKIDHSSPRNEIGVAGLGNHREGFGRLRIFLPCLSFFPQMLVILFYPSHWRKACFLPALHLVVWLLFQMHRMCVGERFVCINNGIIHGSIVLWLCGAAAMSSVIFLPEEAACPSRLTGAMSKL